MPLDASVYTQTRKFLREAVLPPPLRILLEDARTVTPWNDGAPIRGELFSVERLEDHARCETDSNFNMLKARARLCSGCVVISEETVRRVGIERRQSRIEAEPRRAVRTEDRVRFAHINVDVRVVLRRGHTDALEFLYPNADFRDAAVVPELRIAAAGHRLRPL